MSTYLKYKSAWMLKYKTAWLQLLIFGSLTIAIFLAVSVVALLIIPHIYQVSAADFQTMDFTKPSMVSAIKAYQAIGHIALFTVPSLVFAYLSDKKPLSYIGFKKPVPAGFLLIAAVVIIGAFPMVAWLGEINQNIHLPESLKATEKALRDAEAKNDHLLQRLLDMKSVGDLILSLFILAVLPAIGEELFFRGVLQRLFIQIMKRPWAGIIFTAILFSAFHGLFLGFIPRAVLGIILGALFWYSGSLWPGIIAHFINNALQIVVMYYNPGVVEKDMEFAVPLIAGSTLIVVGLTWLMDKKSQTSFAEVYDTDDDFPIGRRDDYTT